MIETVRTSLEQRIDEDYVIYAAAIADNRSAMADVVFGFPVEFIDITLQENIHFCKLLRKLDGKAHGDSALAAEGWVMLDCGLLPSAYVGLGKLVENCSAEVKEKLGVGPNYEGIVPLSEYCIIPRVISGSWVSHTLATIDQGKRLGFLTKVIGLKLFNVGHYIGVAQYTNPALKTHTLLGDLQLKTAMAPIHDYPDMTFVYEQWVYQSLLEHLPLTVEQPREPDFFLDPSNLREKQALQRSIEKGDTYYIISPGHVYLPERADKLVIPMVKR